MNRRPDWKYAGQLFDLIFSTKKIAQFDADNKLYTNNTLKRAQWDVVSILFSFGDNKYKLTEEHSDWARSGVRDHPLIVQWGSIRL